MAKDAGIGEKLRKLRINKGLTQLDLSGIDGENKENVLRLVGMLKEPVK